MKLGPALEKGPTSPSVPDARDSPTVSLPGHTPGTILGCSLKPSIKSKWLIVPLWMKEACGSKGPHWLPSGDYRSETKEHKSWFPNCVWPTQGVNRHPTLVRQEGEAMPVWYVAVRDPSWSPFQHPHPSYCHIGPHISYVCHLGGMKPTSSAKESQPVISYNPGHRSRTSMGSLFTRRLNFGTFDGPVRTAQFTFSCCS